jgi:TRAP-type mannitol/chloroaromatic compound transport system permease small subunit
LSYESSTDLESAPGERRGRDSPFGYLVDGMNGLGSVLIFAVMGLMVADVLMRDLFNRPIDGVAEMVAISIIAVVFLQLASTLRHGRMSRADLFIDGFTLRHPRAGNLIHVLFSLAGAFVCGVILYATYPRFAKAWVENEFFGVQGVFTMPTWPLQLVVLVGCAVTALQYLLHAVWHLRRAWASPARAPGVAR